VPRSALHINKGTPRQNLFTQDSGLKVTTTSCSDCGGMLRKTINSPEFKDLLILFAGLLDKDISNFKPDAELWIKHRASWIPLIANALQAQEFL
jgi:hypothetical protein